MKATLLGTLALLTVTAGNCCAGDLFGGTPFNNTPIDVPSWHLIPRQEPDPSYLSGGTSPTRGPSTRWVYPDGRFEFQGDGRWIELRRNGTTSHFREVGR